MLRLCLCVSGQVSAVLCDSDEEGPGETPPSPCVLHCLRRLRLSVRPPPPQVYFLMAGDRKMMSRWVIALFM